MKYLKKIVFIIAIINLSTIGFSQPKHALLIGINKYYKLDSLSRIVLDPHNSLNGCINDAESIKSLLITRFGFKSMDIKLLYDSLATQQNILLNIDTLLAQCDTGSVAFVYYSGHGMSIQYGKYDYQTEEVICPADIFLTRKYSCIQNSELAVLFNKFVDKKVKLTSIFDCCFSFGTTEFEPNMWESMSGPIKVKKVMSAGPDNNPSKPTPIKSKREILFDLISEANEQLVAVPDEEEVNLNYEEDYLNLIQHKEIEYNDYSSIMRDANPDSTQWGFKYKLFPFNPPSLRTGSEFLFLSATNDKQKAIEIKDENGFKHGIFTKALINVFRENPASTSVSDVFFKIQNQIGNRFYHQTPSRSTAESRRDKTLIGMEQNSEFDFVVADLLENIGDTLFINKGALSGLSIGNKIIDLFEPSIKAEIVALYGRDSAKAKQFKNFPTTIGHQFMVYDWSVKSKPLINVYLPKDPNEVCSFYKLDSIYNVFIVPLRSSKYFLPFEKKDEHCSKIYLKGDGISLTYVDSETKKTSAHKIQNYTDILTITRKQNFIVYLPLPIPLVNAVRAECQKNQNLQIVSNLKSATVSFYCAYYKNLNNTYSDTYKSVKSNDLFVRNVIPSGLVIAGSSETVGSNRYKPGHFYSTDEEPYIVVEKNMPGNLKQYTSLLKTWFNYKASKRGWLNFDEKF